MLLGGLVVVDCVDCFRLLGFSRCGLYWLGVVWGFEVIVGVESFGLISSGHG